MAFPERLNVLGLTLSRGAYCSFRTFFQGFQPMGSKGSQDKTISATTEIQKIQKLDYLRYLASSRMRVRAEDLASRKRSLISWMSSAVIASRPTQHNDHKSETPTTHAYAMKPGQ